MPLQPTPPARFSLQTLAYASLVITILIWGVAPAVVRSFSLLTGPADAMIIRSVVVALFCLAFLPFLRGSRFELQDVPRLLVTSWAGMFGYFLGSIFGYAHVTSGVGGVITATQPLLIALLAAALGMERLTLATIAGLFISFTGTLLLFWGDNAGAIPRAELAIGSLFVFGSGVAWAIYVVAGRPLLQKYGALRITILAQLLCVLPSLAFYSSTTLPAVQQLDAAGWLSLLYLTLIGSILTLATWNYAAAHLKTSIVGASLYMIPVLAILAGAMLLGEPVLASTFIAGAIILFGVAVAQFGGAWRLPASWIALLAVLFAVTSWGMVPVITRYLVLNLPLETVMVLRVAPAGIIGMVIALANGWKPLPWSAWQRAIIAAIGGNVMYQLLAIYGAQHIPASWMGMLFGLEPVFIALFSILFASERPTFWLYAGIAISIAGTALLMLGNAVAPAQDVKFIGIVLVTLSTMGWGIYTVAIKPVAERHGSLQITGLTLALSSLPMLFFISPAFVHSLGAITPFQWSVFGAVVIFCTILSTFAWNYAVSRMQGSLAGMFLYVQPVVAAISGALLLGERITFTLLAGGFLILAGVALAQFGPKLARPAEPAADLIES